MPEQAKQDTSYRPGVSFLNPPLVETALSVQFDELADFRTSHFGLFQQYSEGRFAVGEDLPRLPPVFEVFPRSAGLGFPMVQVGPAAGPSRVMFRDASDESFLVQVQPDRFVLNWRRSADAKPYGRFAAVRDRFLKELAHFGAFCDHEQLGSIAPNLVEVVYVNHIETALGESAPALFSKVLGVTAAKTDAGESDFEIAQLNRVYPIGLPSGRLYVEAGLAQRAGQQTFVALSLAARLHTASRDASGINESLELAHQSVVHAFCSLTDHAVQVDRWGRKEACP